MNLGGSFGCIKYRLKDVERVYWNLPCVWNSRWRSGDRTKAFDWSLSKISAFLAGLKSLKFDDGFTRSDLLSTLEKMVVWEPE